VGAGTAVRLWDVTSGALLRELPGHPEAVHSLQFSPDGTLLAAGAYQVVRLWNPETGAEVRTLPGHAHRVVAVAFSPDGSTLAAAGGLPTRSGEVKLWDVRMGTLKATLAE